MSETIEKGAILYFPKSLIDRAVISHIVRVIDVDINILSAQITPEEDGRMFAIFSGKASSVEKALQFLRDSNVEVTTPVSALLWDEEKCVHCGACVGQCLSKAFVPDPVSGKVVFDPHACIACKLCLPACGYGALEMLNNHVLKDGGAR